MLYHPSFNVEMQPSRVVKYYLKETEIYKIIQRRHFSRAKRFRIVKFIIFAHRIEDWSVQTNIQNKFSYRKLCAMLTSSSSSYLYFSFLYLLIKNLLQSNRYASTNFYILWSGWNDKAPLSHSMCTLFFFFFYVCVCVALSFFWNVNTFQ